LKKITDVIRSSNFCFTH